MNVSAVIVTRGDVDLEPIIDSLCDRVHAIVVWDNSGASRRLPGRPPTMPGYMKHLAGEDLAVYGRYAALEYVTDELVLVQDDDCVLAPGSIQALVDAHEPGHVVCNMPAAWREQEFYAEHALVGFGAVFERGLPCRTFERFLSHGIYDPFNWPFATDGICDEVAGWVRCNPWLARTCDVVFTALTPRVLVDVPYENLPWATAPDRMYRQPEHVAERQRMLDLALKVRDAEAIGA